MDFLDSLELFNDSGHEVFLPFQNTARYKGHICLCRGLDRKDGHQPLLEPVRPDAFSDGSSDATSSGEEMIAETFHYFDSVGEAFGPQGGDTRLDYMVNKELATSPAVREMTLVTYKGDRIVIKPKLRPRRRLTRGCVELTISEWMQDQSNLPPMDPRKHVVQWRTTTIIIDGEAKQVPVWVWRGLEQDQDNPTLFRILL